MSILNVNLSGDIEANNIIDAKSKGILKEKTSFSGALSPSERRIQRLNSELLRSIEAGDVLSFNRCLDEGANYDSRCRETGYSTCHFAILCDQCSLLSELLNRGADHLKFAVNGFLPIHIAAYKNCLPCLQTLVEANPSNISFQISYDNENLFENILLLDSWDHDHTISHDIETQISAGSTALHIACQQLNLSIVEFLLLKGADPTTKDSKGMTPLHIINNTLITHRHKRALLSGVGSNNSSIRSLSSNSTTDTIDIDSDVTSKIIFLLIDYCTKMKSLIESGKSRTLFTSLLHPAALTQNEKLLKNLLRHDVDLSVRDEFDNTALHLAMKHRLKRTLLVLMKFDKVKQNLLEARDSDGRTPLLLAVSESWNYGCSVLLEIGANITASTSRGNTVLHLAAMNNNESIIKELLTFKEIKKVLEKENAECESPLMVAVHRNNVGCVEKLIDSGASIRTTTHDHQSVLHVAARKGYTDIVELILRHPDTAIWEARSAKGDTALHLASSAGHVHCVQSLLREGCSSEAETLNLSAIVYTSSTPIITHVVKDSDDHLDEDADEESATGDICNVPVQFDNGLLGGSPIKEKYDFGGGTALHCACVKGNLSVIKCLLEHNPKLISQRNVKGWSGLHLACYFNHPECVSYLVHQGANLSSQVRYLDGKRRCALDIIAFNFRDPRTFLQELLDSFIETNRTEYPHNHPEFCITFDFSVLAPNNDVSGRQMKVLQRLLNITNECLQYNLLVHPLIQTFLYLKWRKLRTFFLGFTLFFYIIFTLSLTAFALLQFMYISTQRDSTDGNTAAAHATNIVTAHSWATPVVFTVVSIMFLCLVPLSLQEIMQAMKLQRYYLSNLETWIKWFTFGVAFFFCVQAFRHDGGNVTKLSNWIYELLPLTVLFSWIEILFLLSRFPIWGLYVLMFFRVTTIVIKVLCTFACLIIGFMFSFYILFQGMDPFPSLPESFVNVIAMMFEFNYDSVFAAKRNDHESFKIIPHTIFLLFVTLIAIVLMNLMVGLAVSDIAALEAQGHSRILVKQIEFLSLLETFYCKKWLENNRMLPRRWKNRLFGNRNIPKTYRIRPSSSFPHRRATLPNDMVSSIFTKVTGMAYQDRLGDKGAQFEGESFVSGGTAECAETRRRTELNLKLMNIAKELESIRATLVRDAFH